MADTAREIRFRLPHMEIAAKAWGPSDGLPVIGLHGWLDNAATFDEIAPRLTGVNLVSLDLAGHGLSDHIASGGYSLWQQASTVLQVAEELGWNRFALLGHSMGAIISAVLAGSLPERVIGAGLIDGLLPFTSEADHAPAQMARFLNASLKAPSKRKPVYDSVDKAITARVLGGNTPMTREAASLLVERGLMAKGDGWTWRTDPQLMLPSALRFSRSHALAFIEAIRSPVCLVLAKQGVFQKHPEMLGHIRGFDHIRVEEVDGGHHLHLEAQAGEVATILDSFFKGLA